MSAVAPEVFVFVPSYNHAPFIERCLQSIIKQTLKPNKLLVIDDGSRDDSVRIIERVLKDCPFPSQLIARENRGLCRTLNEGFAESYGEYFAYLGSDDVWMPQFLERRAALMEASPKAVMAYGNAFLIDEDDRVVDNSAGWDAYKFDDQRKMLLLGIAPVSSTVFYRRRALAEVGWNEDSRLEDYELYLKLSAIGDFAFDPEINAAWRQHGYNTSADLPLMLKEVQNALRRNADRLELDAETLTQVHREVCFRYAEDFGRRGLKKEAWRLALNNLRGARNLSTAVHVFLRLLAPIGLLRARRHLWREKATARFGKVEV